MWGKLTSALRGRNDTDNTTNTNERNHETFSSNGGEQEHPVPAPSPPSSPSKHGRLGLFKRGSKAPELGKAASMRVTGTGLLGRKRAGLLSIDTNMNGSNMVLARHSTDALPLPSPSPIPRHSMDSATPHLLPPRTPLDPKQFLPPPPTSGSARSILRDKSTPKATTPGTGASQSVRFFSRDAYRVITPDVSTTTDDNSANNSKGEPKEQSFLQRLREMSPERYPSADGASGPSDKYHSALASPDDLFSPPPPLPLGAQIGIESPTPDSIPNSSSRLPPIQRTEPMDVFDLSAAHEHGVQPIPFSAEGGIQDGAVEITDDEPERPAVFRKMTEEEKSASASSPTSSSGATPNSSASNLLGSRSLGRKAGEAVFSALKDESRPAPPRASSSLGLYKLFSSNSSNAQDKEGDGQPLANQSATAVASHRARAQSERVFRRIPQSEVEQPEADIKDESSPNMLLYADGEPDPFSADARNYYTADAGIANSPPRIHSRSGSNDSDMSRDSQQTKASLRSKQSASNSRITTRSTDSDVILSLRTKLNYHQELSQQYELDLSAKDEQISLLLSKVNETNEQNVKCVRALRSTRKRVGDLEKVCRSFEDEIDRSRAETAERSIMDEASGEALRTLHRQISSLKLEKGEVERREADLRAENERLRVEVEGRMTAERLLKQEIDAAKSRIDVLHSGDSAVEEDVEDVKKLMVKGEKEYSLEVERHRMAEFEWQEERAKLVTQVEEQESELRTMKVLQGEVNSQWANAERLNGQIEELQGAKAEVEKERDELKAEVAALEAKIVDMEVEWTESENRRAELEGQYDQLWSAKDEVERERDAIQQQMAAEHAEMDELKHDLESRMAQAAAVGHERDFAVDNVARLERLLQERQAELAETEHQLSEQTAETDALRDALTGLQHTHARLQADAARIAEDTGTHDAHVRAQLEEAVRKQAEAGVVAGVAQERAASLESELERLRRQVHLLKQESADHEMKMVQMARQHEQDKEDKMGLNIALDSKQQELELLKRKMGVCGTAGSTPAPSSRAGPRRESAMFTPIPMRPPSALSDNGNGSSRPSRAAAGDISAVGKTPIPALGRSTRVNANANAPSSALKTVKPSRISDAAMGPPLLALRPRHSVSSSVSATPALARSSSVRTATAAHHRRVSSSALALHQPLSSKAAFMRSAGESGNVSDESSVQEDKENARPAASKPTPTKIARRTQVMSPA